MDDGPETAADRLKSNNMSPNNETNVMNSEVKGILELGHFSIAVQLIRRSMMTNEHHNQAVEFRPNPLDDYVTLC